MARLKSAFFCTNLRTGTLIVGWLNMVFSILLLAVAGTVIDSAVEDRLRKGAFPTSMSGYEREEEMKAYRTVAKSIAKSIVYGTVAVSVAINISLLYGATKGCRAFLLPYLIFYGFGAVISFLSILSDLVSGMHGRKMSLALVTLAISIYFLCVVASFYWELDPAANQDVRGEVTHLQFPSNGGVTYVVHPTNQYIPVQNQTVFVRQPATNPYMPVQNPAAFAVQPPPYSAVQASAGNPPVYPYMPEQNQVTHPVVSSEKEFSKMVP